jgi:hypothetical protein
MKNKWLWIVIGVVAVVILSKGAAVPAMAKLLRFLVPIALIYLAYKFARQAFFPKVEHAPRSMPKYGGEPRTGETILICADCGNEKAAKHKCPA